MCATVSVWSPVVFDFGDWSQTQLKAPLNTCNTCTATHHKPLIHVNAFSKHTFNLGQPVIALLHRPPQVPLQGHGTARPSAAPNDPKSHKIFNYCRGSVISTIPLRGPLCLWKQLVLHASCCARQLCLLSKGWPRQEVLRSSIIHSRVGVCTFAAGHRNRRTPCECVL